MLDSNLKAVDGAAAGAWIEPRLGGEFGAVTRQVPNGFTAYARIFHSASDREGKPVRWEEVAKVMGTTAHREMQWYALVRSLDPCVYDDSKWPGSSPMTGDLNEPELNVLRGILAAHTNEPENCFFGLCTILSGTEQIVPPQDQKQPLLKLPMERDHIVLQGPLSAMEHPPNLIWPPDCSWLVASEVDFDSTLVGGSNDLIQAILNSPDLEAWRVEPDDSLACDADKINVVSVRGNS